MAIRLPSNTSRSHSSRDVQNRPTRWQRQRQHHEMFHTVRTMCKTTGVYFSRSCNSARVDSLRCLSDNSTRSTPPIDLTTSSGATPALTLYAENAGELTQDPTKATYKISFYTNNSVPGFTDLASANLVTLRVAWPANALAANQTYR